MAGNLRALLAEFLGTFAWVAFGAGAVCADVLSGGRIGWVGVALAQGLAVATAYGVFGSCAIGRLNPALTLALAAFRRIEPAKAALCVLCQLLGASLAGLFLAAIFSSSPMSSEPPFLGATAISGLGFRSATLLEAVLTFFLALTAFAPGGGEPGPRALLLGALVASATLLAGPLTGAAMNPARAFGPAIATGFWQQHYVYWIGPLAGAMAGMLAAQYPFEKK